MDTPSLKFFEELCNAPGPSGFEVEAIRIVNRMVSEHADKTYSDKMGNFMFEKKGKAGNPRILLVGHVDEVGFIVTGLHPQGYLSFNPLGYWFDQTLLGQRVLVMTKGCMVPGVISMKCPFLMDHDEARKVVTKEKMFIDVGASNLKELEEMGIRMGDAVMPDSRFSTVTKTSFKDGKTGTRQLAFGKAFDDRFGVFVAAEVIRKLKEEGIPHENTVIGAATVQEEVGTRGARTIANSVLPDVAIVLDVEIAGDVPGTDPQAAPVKMGEGVTLCVFDATMIPNQPLKELVIHVGERNGIPLQLMYASRGGTDGGMIHTSNIGVPTIAIGVAVRHIHTHVGVIDLEDVDNAVRLVIELIKELDIQTVNGLTSI